MRSALLEIQGVHSIPRVKAQRTCKLTELIWPGYAHALHRTEQYAPDRIIIESSGSAFPATLAWQVRQLEEEGLLLDAVVSASASPPFAYAS